MGWELLVGAFGIIISALVSIATANMRISARTLKDAVDTLEDIQVELARHDERLKSLEKRQD